MLNVLQIFLKGVEGLGKVSNIFEMQSERCGKCLEAGKVLETEAVQLLEEHAQFEGSHGFWEFSKFSF